MTNNTEIIREWPWKYKDLVKNIKFGHRVIFNVNDLERILINRMTAKPDNFPFSSPQSSPFTVLLTVEETAKRLGISPITLRGRKRIKKYKDLPSVLIGRNLYFYLKDIDDLIQGKFITDSMKAQESTDTSNLKCENPDSIVIVDDANLDVGINLIE